jgi:hypothetical protein
MSPGEWVGKYIAKAEALIELLEIHDCGSVGGFDPDSGGDSLHGLLYLEDRFEALKLSRIIPRNFRRCSTSWRHRDLRGNGHGKTSRSCAGSSWIPPE